MVDLITVVELLAVLPPPLQAANANEKTKTKPSTAINFFIRLSSLAAF
jgi:hypothetical protein